MRIGPWLAAIAAVAPLTAGAATTTYYHAGSWHAFSGTDAQDRLVCGIGTSDQADGRSLQIVFAIGGRNLEFSARKPNWAIPPGTRVGTVMRIGAAAPWTMEATGNGNTLTWTLPGGAVSGFEQQFRRAGRMTLDFPNGNEPPWTLSLAGSTAADNTLARCVNDLTQQTRPAAPPTQPFGQPPTQPFLPPPGPVSAAPLGPVSPAPPTEAAPTAR